MKRMKKGQRLWMKLTLMVLLTVFVTLFALYFLLNQQIAKSVRKDEEVHLLKIARTIAKYPLVHEALIENKTSAELQNYANEMQENYDLDFVVVMTMDHLRLTHPDAKKINQHFQGGDEELAIHGKESTSTAKGTLGESLRGFVPVFDDNGREIGVIALGIKTTTIKLLSKETMKPFTLSLMLAFSFGLAAAMFTAYTLKKQMYDLEPQEIARLLEERNAMLDYTKDAIIVTDKENKIILSNFEAKRIFNLISEEKDLPIEGGSIKDFLPDVKDIPEISADYQTIDKLYHQNGVDYLLSAAPILVRKKVIGQIITLRDATELYLLTDQLFNTTAYATSLQAQSHDFLNKLHVIYGLTDLEDYDQLMSYLEKILEPEQEFSQRMVYLVHNPVIAGFLIGERSKFSEKGDPFMIEVYPDIPTTNQNENVQYWISLIRFLNHFILENQLAEQLQVRLGFWNQQLQTTYELRIETTLQTELLTKIKGRYFSSLLTFLAGELEIEYTEEWLKLSFHTIYLKEDEI
ncbi:Spo0B domain-containing protein [Carnobacterium gallinarum]|uniref:Spo0B domain-containing protein n=1 Tax=Carnobacterium gallinarum TaxID=2749 RepID=UPI0005541F1C|nr:sensor histidine kinase [Carnobacterium gallinarum]